MKTRLRAAWPFLVIALFMLYWPARYTPRLMYNGDELVKYAQTRGLLDSGFRSEAPVYPARHLDPEYKFSPMAAVYVIALKDRPVSAFPIAFSILTAPVVALGGYTLPLLMSILMTMAFLWSLRHFWKLGNFLLLFAGLGTWVCIYGIFYSEVLYFLLLLFLGMSLFLAPPAPEAKTPGRFLLAGLLMGLSTWLRLEGALFYACLASAYIIVERAWNPFKDRRLLLTTAGAAAAILALMLMNYLLYEHPLGPRFVVNIQGFGDGLTERLRSMRVLLLMGDFKPGFFLYLPIIAAVLLNALRPGVFAALDRAHRTLLISTLLFLPLASFLAPNDGAAGWGPRYLIAAVPPAILLLNQFLNRIDLKGRGMFSPARLGLFAVMGFSILVSILGLMVFTQAVRQLRTYQEEFRSVKADIRLFQNPALAGHLGLDYLKVPALRASTPEKLKALTILLRRKAPGRLLAFHDKPVPPELLKHLSRLKKRDRKFILNPAEAATYRKILQDNFELVEKRKLKNSFALIYRIPGRR